jgi:hypothetical protein
MNGHCTNSATLTLRRPGTLSYAEIGKIVSAGATVEEDLDAGVAIVTWYLGTRFQNPC